MEKSSLEVESGQFPSKREMPPVLNLSEIVPEGMHIEGIEDLQKKLNDSHEELAEAAEHLYESMRRYVESKAGPTPEKVSFAKQVAERLSDFLNESGSSINEKLGQFVSWLDRLSAPRQ